MMFHLQVRHADKPKPKFNQMRPTKIDLIYGSEGHHVHEWVHFLIWGTILGCCRQHKGFFVVKTLAR